NNNVPTVATWEEALTLAGEVVRLDGNDGDTAEKRAIARTYTVNRARRYLDLHKTTLSIAIDNGHLSAFIDPHGNMRIPAGEVERLLQDTADFEQIAEMERISVYDLADALGVRKNEARKRMRKHGLEIKKAHWYQMRGTWGLPETLAEFRMRIRENREARRIQKREQREFKKQRKREQREEERQRRAELSAKLVASFPAWSELDRSRQMMMLHVGPPNSGKTHDSLNRLAEAGSGWYLAPLRLLAWEVYDRLNARGVPCNLLTGEEHIPVEGAEITASTIEMFNPNRPGEVVIIDEAQMLADPDRGWAWTRALMSSTAPEMHVIAPHTARGLIQKMAEAANIPMGTVEHERLTPISVANKTWSIENMPDKTILVAFSRKMVLTLKTRLEAQGSNISVVYGGLPPEVRRKQAERFAAGETEICVATDAVGMGLNLPADHVCFWEMEKFDGRTIRTLKSSEVQQIGGRAGRYGFSETGLVGATRKNDLRLLRNLFYQTPPDLTHARVAPSVNDLELIPGSLSEKLEEWAQLESIPPELRRTVKTADMTERVELASMLTDQQVEKLGIADAVQLVNAPTRKSTRDYWYDCAMCIIHEVPMPVPPAPPVTINNTGDLDYIEMCIACADVYLWLAYRNEFRDFGADFTPVQEARREWSDRIDEALLNKLRTSYIPRRR
ncbi:MAG: helicase-related protein, partial [Chloroflexota bacterium]